jgi:hypothetical protein
MRPQPVSGGAVGVGGAGVGIPDSLAQRALAVVRICRSLIGERGDGDGRRAGGHDAEGEQQLE